MSNPLQPTIFIETHQNRGLFSDHYLDEVVPTLAEWDDDDLYNTILKPLREELRQLLESIQPASLDEAQLEEKWVQPVLEKLGHYYSVQVKIRYRGTGYRKPDYGFTATEAEANALTNQIYEPAGIAHLLAVGDAKAWGIPLDQASGKERNPSQQIDEYLRYSELPWGILTDGRYWRLYHRESSKDNLFYAVDLQALLAGGDERQAVESFSYFYLFFRREAFVRDGWLDKIRSESVTYAEGLSDQLEEEVYEALRLIAEGFLKYRRNRLTADPATLRQIYENSLVLLYRLLFILYAESRDVLPMGENGVYAQHRSLRALNKDVFLNILEGDTDYFRRVDEAGIYEKLGSLFFAIDQGDDAFNVPPYNGRLFSEDEHPFLAEKRIGDAYLAQALDRLGRVYETNVPRGRRPRRVLVDYRDLDVRHLGAIYEKLLEYELHVADVDLTEKGNKYQPAGENDAVKVRAGEAYLRTGNNERKITGSYYTPDYIVQFIVERTLEPLLRGITEQYAALDAEGHWVVPDAQKEPLRKAILSINVLDPATGSGHFMVGAVAYIAEWLRRLALQPADMPPDEDELVYWKRQAVTACIYGLDVNPLAVELAKLSLWLATIGRGKPLSFLNHHVKLGNTLVGARAAEITPELPKNGKSDGQLPIFDDSAFIETLSKAVADMGSIEATRVNTVKDVKDQEHTFADLQKAVDPLRLLAHIWTARYFNLEISPGEWEKLYKTLVTTDADAVKQIDRALVEQIEALLEKYRFFHWDLEFPEVFFDADGKPLPDGGFDAVIGNPPYVRQERIQPYKPYLEANYDVYSGTADLFLYFYERALKLVKPSQRVGYITSGTFTNNKSSSEFRSYVVRSATFDSVVDFGAVQPFRGADLATNSMIVILKNGKYSGNFRSLFIEGRKPPESLTAEWAKNSFECSLDTNDDSEWRFQSVQLTQLLRRIVKDAATVREIVGKDIYYGIKTGFNDAFIINAATSRRLIEEHPSSAEIIKPLRRGENLRPWYQSDGEEFIIFTRHGTTIENYPAIKRHLEGYRNRIEPKPDNWDEKTLGEWKGRKAGSYAWYEIQDQVNYYEQFTQPKIMWPNISKLPRFSWDTSGLYLNDTCAFIVPKNQSILAILNSRVAWFVISQIASPLAVRAGDWRYQPKIQFVERLPIPELSAAQESNLAALAEEITALARGRYMLHENMRDRIRTDLGGGQKLNNALDEWWELDFSGLREAVKAAFKSDIPLADRNEWTGYLADQVAKHQAATTQIIERETRLNAVVYEAFKLTPDDIALIETATKYPYGAV